MHGQNNNKKKNS